MQIRSAIAGAAIVVVALAGCASSSSSESESESTPAATVSVSPTDEATAEATEAAEPAAEQPVASGGYVDLATYQADPAAFDAGNVVLFFNASWCPTCQTANRNFEAEAFPAGLTIVSVDFDDNTDLRRQYGVTVQHTFVQVDPAGSELAKWTGSNTVAEVESRLV